MKEWKNEELSIGCLMRQYNWSKSVANDEDDKVKKGKRILSRGKKKLMFN